jgi:hypothetical protein
MALRELQMKKQWACPMAGTVRAQLWIFYSQRESA